MSHLTKRILIVDDNPVNCEICKEILEDDYEIEIAESGEAALESAGAFQPDLILLDVMMPGIDGLEVCRQLRSSTRSWVKIIMVSAKVQTEDRIAGYEAGADDYLAKPFDEHELLAKIGVHLRMKHIEEIDDVKCRLLQVLQHGNRTPMTHILSNIDILRNMHDELTEQERRERTEVVHRGAVRLHDWLVCGEQLVALMTGQFKFSPQRLDIDKQVSEVVQRIEARDPQFRGRIQVAIASGVRAECDPEFLDLLVDRLLSDTLACTAPATPIIFGVDQSDSGRLRISVNRGNEPLVTEILPRLFDPFGVPNDVLHNLGDGMSLAIVREITRIHGGLVRAKNVEAGYVEIVAELPLEQPQQASPVADQQNQGII